MKLSARKFAVAIWVVAAMTVVIQVLPYVNLMNASSHMDTGRIVLYLVNALVFPGSFLAALGAVVYLLGEIRDRLPERSN